MLRALKSKSRRAYILCFLLIVLKLVKLSCDILLSNVKCRIANEGELGMLKTAKAEVFEMCRLRLCHEQEKWHRKTLPSPLSTKKTFSNG